MRIRNLILLLAALILCTSCAHAGNFDLWWPWIYRNIQDFNSTTNDLSYLLSRTNAWNQAAIDAAFAVDWINTNGLADAHVPYTGATQGVDLAGQVITNERKHVVRVSSTNNNITYADSGVVFVYTNEAADGFFYLPTNATPDELGVHFMFSNLVTNKAITISVGSNTLNGFTADGWAAVGLTSTGYSFTTIYLLDKSSPAQWGTSESAGTWYDVVLSNDSYIGWRDIPTNQFVIQPNGEVTNFGLVDGRYPVWGQKDVTDSFGSPLLAVNGDDTEYRLVIDYWFNDPTHPTHQWEYQGASPWIMPAVQTDAAWHSVTSTPSLIITNQYDQMSTSYENFNTSGTGYTNMIYIVPQTQGVINTSEWITRP